MIHFRTRPGSKRKRYARTTRGTTRNADERAGAAYCQFIELEIEREYARRTFMDGRAGNSFTLSSGIAGVAVAASAFLLGEDFTLPRHSVEAGLIALLSLGLGGLCSLIAVAPLQKYKVANGETLGQLVGAHWRDSDEQARHAIATINISTILSLREGTNRKARWTLAGLTFQLVGVVAFGVAVAISAAAERLHFHF